MCNNILCQLIRAEMSRATEFNYNEIFYDYINNFKYRTHKFKIKPLKRLLIKNNIQKIGNVLE